MNLNLLIMNILLTCLVFFASLRELSKVWENNDVAEKPALKTKAWSSKYIGVYQAGRQGQLHAAAFILTIF